MMARRRGWRRRRNRRSAFVGVRLLAAVVVVWLRLWIVVLGVVGLGGIGALVWWGGRSHREIRRKDAIAQAEQRIRDADRTLEKVDTLDGDDFERIVA